MAETVKKGMLHGRRYLCGVPDRDCFGSLLTVGKKGHKIHSSSDEAFTCMKKHLIKEGFTQVGPREFAAPNDGPIRVLTKKSRYGCPLRPGKENRWMGEGVGAIITSL